MPLIVDPDDLSQGAIDTVTDATFSGASGASITINSAGAQLPVIAAGAYLEIRSATNTNNRGLYLVTGTPTTSAITMTKQALNGSVVNPANDAGAQTVRVFGSTASPKSIHIDTTLLMIQLINGAGQVDDEGVVGQALYSFLKEEWRSDPDLIKFPFPVVAITPEQFEFTGGWTLADFSEGSTVNTADPSNTRNLLRTSGWSEVNDDGFITRSYAGIITLGNIDFTTPQVGDKAYYFFENSTAETEFTFAGPVNESVLIVDGIGNPASCNFATSSTITRASGSFVTDGFAIGRRVFIQNAANPANNGSFVITNVVALTLTVSGTPFTTGADAQALLAVDYRNELFTARIRIFGKTYDQSTSVAIGVTTTQGLRNQVYRFPLSEGTDNVIQDLANVETAGNVATLLSNITGGITAPYNDMTIAYFAMPQTRSGFNAIGGDTPSPGDTQFGTIVDGDVSVVDPYGGGAASAEQIYAFVQARLQDTIDINDGAGAAAVVVRGTLAEPLLELASTGNTMSSLLQTANPGGDGNGVYVDSFGNDDINRVAFVDNDGDTRTFPFQASGDILFNNNIQNDASAIYRMFFTTNPGGNFGTINAITVQDATDTDIAGNVSGAPSISFTFDYDGNVQGGRTAATDAAITIVSIGLSTSQYVLTTGLITRANGQTFSLVAALERNFSNP